MRDVGNALVRQAPRGAAVLAQQVTRIAERHQTRLERLEKLPPRVLALALITNLGFLEPFEDG